MEQISCAVLEKALKGMGHISDFRENAGIHNHYYAISVLRCNSINGRPVQPQDDIRSEDNLLARSLEQYFEGVAVTYVLKVDDKNIAFFMPDDHLLEQDYQPADIEALLQRTAQTFISSIRYTYSIDAYMCISELQCDDAQINAVYEFVCNADDNLVLHPNKSGVTLVGHGNTLSITTQLGTARTYSSYILARDIGKARNTLLQLVETDDITAVDRSMVLNLLGWTIEVNRDQLSDQDRILLTERCAEVRLAGNSTSLKCTLDNYFKVLDQLFEKDAAVAETRVLEVKRYIDRAYTDPNISVTQICDLLHYNMSQTSSLFKKQMGYGILDYIHICRVARVKELIDAGYTGTLEELAAQVGYSSSWTMSRAFRRQTGITPSDYRTSHKVQ